MSQPGSVTPDLEEVRSRFAEWRKRRKKGARIPEPLWSAAAGLAQTHSLTEISQSLKLEFNHLKRRCVGARDAADNSRFVELPFPERASEGLIEVERADGAKLRIRGVPDLKLIELAKAFCR